ncbi:MAG TPA: methylmalonyl-CoA epimerase [candidate division Zixibacteria bacterium]|nr:methylmalonyl-CoA epimerase [candidate division Zixibacteria bacterium]
MLSHIGIAVRRLSEADPQYRLILGCDASHVVEVPDQKVRVAMYEPGGKGTRIELLEPTSPDSPIAKFIEKRGEGLHHICIYVDDIENRLAELKASGARLIDETPRIGAEGGKIAFVHPASAGGVLIELEEKSKSK